MNKHLAVAALLFAGCTTVHVDARSSITPVMLGPIRSLGANTLVDGNTTLTYDSVANVTAGAGLDGSSSSESQKTIAHAFEYQLSYDEARRDDRIWAAAPLVCKQSVLYMLVAASTENVCKLRMLRLFPAGVAPVDRYR